MAWIESHQELARHPKTKKLARILGVSIPEVIGHLHLLWWWAMDYAQDGSLARYDDGDIADAALWDSDPHEFTNALVSAGFLDKTDNGLYIHDWDEYAGRLIEKRKQNTERKRRSRACHADVTQDNNGSHGATKPNQTKPNQTEPNHVVVNTDDAEEREKVLRDVVAAIQQIKPIAKAEERDLINDLVDHYPRDWLIEAIKVAVSQKARSFSYVDGILANWRKDGYKDSDKPWESEKRGKSISKTPPKARSPAEDYSEYDR